MPPSTILVLVKIPNTQESKNQELIKMILILVLINITDILTNKFERYKGANVIDLKVDTPILRTSHLAFLDFLKSKLFFQK